MTNTLEQRAAHIEMLEWMLENLQSHGFSCERAALTAAIAALRLSAGADWQPIETAPRDGTDILIAGGTYSVHDHHDMPFNGRCIAYWDRDHWHGNEANAHDEWCRHQPTHWHPLPAAPRHETGEL